MKKLLIVLVIAAFGASLPACTSRSMGLLPMASVGKRSPQDGGNGGGPAPCIPSPIQFCPGMSLLATPLPSPTPKQNNNNNGGNGQNGPTN